MRLIPVLFTAAALLAASPALAQDRDERPLPSTEQVGRALSNPMVQAGIVAVVGEFVNALLDTRVGPMARYTDRDIGPDDTLRDLARRDDPAFERKLQEKTRRAVATAGAVATDAGAMEREIGTTADRLRKLIDMTSVAVRAATRESGDERDSHDGY